METKQIINGLLDKADRVADQSAGRIMKQAAEKLVQLEAMLEQARTERVVVTKRMLELEIKAGEPKLDLTPNTYEKGYQPMGFIGFAKACPTCKNIGSDHCRRCKMECESGYEPKDVDHE